MTGSTAKGSRVRIGNIALAALLVVWVVVALRNAWLCDDAYITFRTLDNWLGGYGLRWNVAERVQTYTHPLWLLVLALFLGVTGELYCTVIAVSIALSLVAVVLMSILVAKTRTAGVAAVSMLGLSKAFMDYSTSGLENPLSYVLLVLFLLAYLKAQPTRRTLFLLSLIAALGILNRMDAVLLYGPALAVAWWRVRSWRSVGVVCLGFLPFVLWEGFSLFYYGSPFPNTAYAKLFQVRIGSFRLAKRGVLYLWNSARVDPITLLTILCAVAYPLLARNRKLVPIALGIMLYLAYVVRVGGDYMSGRFLALPFCCAAAGLVSCESMFRTWRPAALMAVVLVAGFTSPFPTVLTGADYGHQAAWVVRPHMFRELFMDERGVYYPYTGLLKGWGRADWPLEAWVEPDVQWCKAEPYVVTATRVGLVGYLGGAGLHVVDRLALGDPLLARLPSRRVDEGAFWITGHFARVVPEGYIETLATGENRIADKRLMQFYDRIALITRGPLCDWERLEAIANLNLGRYNHLIDEEAYYRCEGVREDTITEYPMRKVP